MELFGIQGFEATSIRQIAERCGVTDAAVLYHFGSKQRILSSLWRQLAGPDVGQLAIPGASLAEQVDAIVGAVLIETARRDAEVRLMVRQALAGDEQAAAVRSEALRAWMTFLESLFARAYPPDEAARRADALMMLIVGCILRAQIDNGLGFARRCEDSAFRAQVQQLAHAISLPCYEEAV
jgi:AcrR family transcriptional regulator